MRRMTLWSWLVACSIACHSAPAAQPDGNAATPDAVTDASPDAAADAAPALPDAAQMVRVYGNIDYNGPVLGATVMTLGDSPQTTTTDADGNFYFDAIQGSRLVMEASPASPAGLVPMIRGVIAEDDIRPRVFYMLGPPDVAAAGSLGESFDPSKAVVEVDFRNSAIGGYGATLTGSDGSAEVPDFGIVEDGSGTPQLGEQTLTGGDGSTLLLAGLPPGDATFAPIVPMAATLPCKVDDANPLPLVAGAVTWFDFECGSGTD